MKTKVFILVPYDVQPNEISDYERAVMEGYRFDYDDPERHEDDRFDYTVGAFDESFHDPMAEGRLPPSVRRAYAGNICDRMNLPADVVPGALITLDGQWHDLHDFGWKMMHEQSSENTAAYARWQEQYRQWIAAAPHCWVIAVWVHS